MEQAEYNKVRYSIKQHCGNKVMIQLDRGRNKVDIQEGIIKEAYPSVFTVLVSDDDEDHPDQLLSFSYKDVITKEIRMKLC
ncbi:MAG: Veg family protein [Lachnospiraceae bacterium]|nr:Veg family protein [Lachnospiraceae bacterium]